MVPTLLLGETGLINKIYNMLDGDKWKEGKIRQGRKG